MNRARELRNNPTEAERVLWRHLRLRQLGGYKFRRQQPVGRYIVDFACLEKRVIIEVDGGQHSEQLTYDTRRDGWLREQGFVVLRFWDHEVLRDINAVTEAIWRALNDPPLSFSPARGEKNPKNAKQPNHPRNARKWVDP